MKGSGEDEPIDFMETSEVCGSVTFLSVYSIKTVDENPMTDVNSSYHAWTSAGTTSSMQGSWGSADHIHHHHSLCLCG